MTILDNAYQAKIDQYADTYGVDRDWFTAMIARESAFDPRATSASDARGLTQVMYRWHGALVDDVARSRNVAPGANALYDPDVSLIVGARHLAWCYESDARRSWERAIRAYHLGTPEPPKNAVDGQGTSSDAHIDAVRTFYREVVAARRSTPETPDMVAATHKAYTVPGGDRPLLLPKHIKVTIEIVNHARVRSYQKYTAQDRTTVHDTGNPRTKARGEFLWLKGGRSGAGAGGYQAIVDDIEIIIAGVFDEVTWAQGTPDGNRRSYAVELAFGANTVWTTALENMCALHGAIIEMQSLPLNDAAVLHQVWYGKYCSAQILNRGIWPQVKAKIIAYAKAAAVARAGGAPVSVPGTTYATPVRPMVDGAPWDGKHDVVINDTKLEAQRETVVVTATRLNRRQWASVESLLTGDAYEDGDEVEVLGWVAGELVDGVSEWAIATNGDRLWCGGLAYEPKTDPDYGQQPETPVDDGSDDIIFAPVPVNGRLYYPLTEQPEDGDVAAGTATITGDLELGRMITIEREGTLHKWADTKSATLETVRPGTVDAPVERRFKYWTRGEELPLELKDADGKMVTVGESIWYAEDLHTGARMWAGLSTERPD